MPDDRYEKGLKTLQKLDPALIDLLDNQFGDIAPDYKKFVVEHVMGDIFSRSVLDVKQREMIALAVLTATGRVSHIELHIRFALNVGVSREEIIETLLQTTVHSGFPGAAVALSIASNVFNELEEE